MIFSCGSEDCIYYSDDEDIGCTRWICGITISDGVCDNYDTDYIEEDN